MHQVLNDVQRGVVTVARVPAPMAGPGEVLIENRSSVISAGTERMVIELSKKSLLGKARERPDHVRRVIQKIRTEGLVSTLQQVREKLSTPMSMGYSSAGVVIACGADVQGYKPGDRVASNGPHAEFASVPVNLCARVPDRVPFEQAAFAVLGSIALQGIRLSKISLGETVLVIGLGLVGQLAVGLLRAAGCRVLGTDPDPSKCALALKMGAAQAAPSLGAAGIDSLTEGVGADAVVITASTKSNGPIELAAAAVRPKGRVVLVGVVGLELDRRPFYFKEAEFVVSCSYGPGRYDPEYEEKGRDYPLAHVRWTEQRNIQAVLDAMEAGALDVAPLISHRFPIARADEAYSLIESGREPFLGIVLSYPESDGQTPERIVSLRPGSAQSKAGIGVLGAGNFARMVLLPAIRRCPELAPLTICSATGVTAADVGKRLGFQSATSDEGAIFDDASVSAVFSITRHDVHARHVIRAIEARKPIFVEKPLCLTTEQLEAIEEARMSAGSDVPLIMVGFNRRFAPATGVVKQFFAAVQAPLTISVRFNAGPIPKADWTQDPDIGGGRIIGEACHAIDLATFLAGSLPVRVFAESIGASAPTAITDDQCFITLRHANGSVSSIAYLAGGDKALPKERVEVLGGGQMAIIDDFRNVTMSRSGKVQRKAWWKQDKGHDAEVRAFAAALKAGGEPIPWREIRAVTRASLLAVQSLREGQPIELV